MSILTAEGLPDPEHMNIFAQMTLGQAENWWLQSQETFAALSEFTGWGGPDAHQHNLLVLEDHKSSHNHMDIMHLGAEMILWVIDTLQLILTLLFIIQLIKLLIALASTVEAALTGGASLAEVPALVAQQIALEIAKRGAELAMRKLIQMVFGALVGAVGGAFVAHDTVSRQHLSGGDAFWTYAQDIGFGALSGSMVGLSPGWAVAGLAVAGSHVWAQQEVTGRSLTWQEDWDIANADIGLPEGAIGVGKAIKEVTVVRSGMSLKVSDGLSTEVRPRNDALLDTFPPVKQQGQSWCLAGNQERFYKGLGIDVSQRRIAAEGGWDGHGMYLSQQPDQMAHTFIRNPDGLAKLTGGETAIVRAARQGKVALEAGDAPAYQAAFERVRQGYHFQAGANLADVKRAIDATGVPLTVATDIPLKGAHAVQIDGVQGEGKWVLIHNPAGGVPFRMRSAEFLAHWRGGQALMPDLEALGISTDLQRATPLARRYQALLAERPIPVDEEPLAGATMEVNPDPLNPAPYRHMVPEEVRKAAQDAAARQIQESYRITIADARVRVGKSPFIDDAGAPLGTVDPVSNTPASPRLGRPGIHAERRTIYRGSNERERVVLQDWLKSHPGDAQVDLVTENIPCRESCTPMVLEGVWSTDLRDAAGSGHDVDFRVWHHGMGTKASDGLRVPGDMTLYSYELPRAASRDTMRRLYISDEMAKRMNWDLATGTPRPSPDPGVTRSPWTLADGKNGIKYDALRHYMQPPADVQVISRADLEGVLRDRLRSDLQSLVARLGPEGAANAIQEQPDLQAFMKSLLGEQDYRNYLLSLGGNP